MQSPLLRFRRQMNNTSDFLSLLSTLKLKLERDIYLYRTANPQANTYQLLDCAASSVGNLVADVVEQVDKEEVRAFRAFILVRSK